MSFTQVYAVHKNGEVRLYEENQNSWRWSPQIWGELEERHLPLFRPSFIPDYIPDDQIEEYAGHKPKRHHLEDMREIWKLFHTEKLSPTERWVLGSTFDNVIVMKENFDELILAYRHFYDKENGTSLLELADIFEKMNMDDDIIGVAWSTSLISSPWWVVEKIDESHPKYTFEEDYIDEDGFCHMSQHYNIFGNKDEEQKHWFLTKVMADTGKEN